MRTGGIHRSARWSTKRTDLNRDTLARHLAPHGIRPVRQVAVDELWSALRFRPSPPGAGDTGLG